MDEPLKFILVEIAPSEEFLKMSLDEGMRQNNPIANRCLKLEALIEKNYLGWNFIKSHHVHTR